MYTQGKGLSFYRFAIPFAWLSSLYAIDYSGSLPSSISLNGGTRSDKVTARSSQGWQVSTIGSISGSAFSIRGVANSQYTLTFESPTNINGVTYYNGGISIGDNLQVSFTNLHTLAVQRGSMSVGSGAQFTLISSGTTISAQGTDYGGDSKVRFGRGTSLILASGANARFTNGNFFIHDGSILVSAGATLSVDATRAIRIQNELTNNGGTITFGGNVYNVGGNVGTRANTTTSNFTSTNGTISITGNFYNGGQVENNAIDSTGSGWLNVYDPPFGGGGSLMLYGGSMSVTGSITSTGGGNRGAGTIIDEIQSSSIGIYGASLSATNGLNNQSGSTITFGVYNGKMGAFTGNVNNSGSIIYNMAGASGGTHTLISGTLSGGGSVALLNGNTEFATATLSTDKREVIVNIKQDVIDSFNATLQSNQKAIVNALGEDIYTIAGANTQSVTSDVNRLNNALFSQFISTPFSGLDVLKGSISAVSISTQSNSPLGADAGAITRSILGSANGGFAGVRLGAYIKIKKAVLSVYGGYTYGSMRSKGQDYTLLESSFSNKSYSSGLGANYHLYLLPHNRLELDVDVGYFTSSLDSKRKIQLNTAANQIFEATYRTNQVSLDTKLGYRLGANRGRSSLKPYFRLLQSYNMFSGFTENALTSGITDKAKALSMPQYNAYFMSLGVGLDGAYRIDRSKYVLFGLDYEQFLLSTQKLQLQFIGGEKLSFDKPYDNRIGLSIGARFEPRRKIQLGLDGYFKAAINQADNLYYYGVSALLGYVF
ncbi:hypothetical protein [uncultured Helicobacter sp.]|uniref:hypothetical protein n=2 Tax=uncultured Helicobacter sp. TaxID=175537 RepID=UPI00261F2763|nr:hypothetical protein [uncultured Helicobacter sp.]